MYTPLPVESIEPSSFIPSPLERDRIRTAGARALPYLIPAQAVPYLIPAQAVIHPAHGRRALPSGQRADSIHPDLVSVGASRVQRVCGLPLFERVSGLPPLRVIT